MDNIGTVYKKDSKGKLRYYSVIIADDEKSFVTKSGLCAEGSKEITRRHFPVAKKYTTLEEQVSKEAEAKLAKKIRISKYHATKECDDPELYTSPMLALDLTKVEHRLDWNRKGGYVAQPKLNGIRAICSLDGGSVVVTSKHGTIYSLPHIEKSAKDRLFGPLNQNNTPIDGELYIHGKDVGEIAHAIKNAPETVEFRVFDMVNPVDVFDDRYIRLGTFNYKWPLSIVPIISINDKKDMLNAHRLFLAPGYEGTIIRARKGMYKKGSRTIDMFKYKNFQDDEFEIVGMDSDKDNAAVLVLKTSGGEIFTSRPTGTLQYRRKLLLDKNKLIGEPATVKYSYLLKSGKPEFNRTIAIRNYE